MYSVSAQGTVGHIINARYYYYYYSPTLATFGAWVSLGMACRKRRLLMGRFLFFSLISRLLVLSSRAGYRGCRNQGPPWWEPRAYKGSLFLSL